jgi:hypothetical protein
MLKPQCDLLITREETKYEKLPKDFLYLIAGNRPEGARSDAHANDVGPSESGPDHPSAD